MAARRRITVAQHDELQAEFDKYKKMVRTEAIRVAKEQGWCNDGLNRSLTRLDLPLTTAKARISFDISVMYRVSAVVDTDVIDPEDDVQLDNILHANEHVFELDVPALRLGDAWENVRVDLGTIETEDLEHEDIDDAN